MTRNLSQIVLLNIVGFTLFLSWYIFVNHGFWLLVGTGIFYLFNQKLVKGKTFLRLVALTNNRAFDGCSLLATDMLILDFWLKENAPSRRRIVIVGLIVLLTTVVLNQLDQALAPVERISPALTFVDINRISKLFSVPMRNASRDNFPGDHGVMLLIFPALMQRYFGKATDLIAPITFIVFAFSRVTIGTHWLTDIVTGLMTVILTSLSWMLLTPLSNRLITFFDKLLPGKDKYFQNK